MSFKSPSQSDTTSSGPINSSSSESINNHVEQAYDTDCERDGTRLSAANFNSIELKTTKAESNCLTSAIINPTLSSILSHKLDCNQSSDGSFAKGKYYEFSTLGCKAPAYPQNPPPPKKQWTSTPTLWYRGHSSPFHWSDWNFRQRLYGNPQWKRHQTNCGPRHTRPDSMHVVYIIYIKVDMAQHRDSLTVYVICGYCWSVPFLVLTLVLTFPVLALAFFWRNEWFVSFSCRRSRLRDANVVVVWVNDCFVSTIFLWIIYDLYFSLSLSLYNN